MNPFNKLKGGLATITQTSRYAKILKLPQASHLKSEIRYTSGQIQNITRKTKLSTHHISSPYLVIQVHAGPSIANEYSINTTTSGQKQHTHTHTTKLQLLAILVQLLRLQLLAQNNKH